MMRALVTGAGGFVGKRLVPLLEARGDDRFALSAEGRAVLADESHVAFGAGFFDTLPQQMTVVEKLPEAFSSGIGLDYDALGEQGARGIERGLATRLHPRLQRVSEVLRGHAYDHFLDASVTLL